LKRYVKYIDLAPDGSIVSFEEGKVKSVDDWRNIKIPGIVSIRKYA
jgi:hypothetical protein